MKRKLVLTTTNLVTHFGADIAIMKGIKKVRPDLTEYENHENYRDVLRTLGITIGVAIVSAVIAGAVTSAVDNLVFPDITGPY